MAERSKACRGLAEQMAGLVVLKHGGSVEFEYGGEGVGECGKIERVGIECVEIECGGIERVGNE